MRKFQQEHIEELARLVKACGNTKDVSEGKRIHAEIIAGVISNRYLDNLLIEMYGKCACVDDARMVFDGIREPNSFSWNIIIQGYAHNGHLKEAKQLFDRAPDKDQVTCNTMITAYAQYGKLQGTRMVFNSMDFRNDVSWNALITAFANSGSFDEAENVCDKMPQWTVISWTAMIGGYAQYGNLQASKSLFLIIPERNIITWTTIIQQHAQNGHLDQAKCMFWRMPVWSIVVCTVMIGTFAHNGLLKDAKDLFDSLPEPDLQALNCMVLAYVSFGYLKEARNLFDRIPLPNVISWTAMFGAYAQQGLLSEAKNMFDHMPNRNVVSWNAMITAYAQNGLTGNAFNFFHMMELDGINANETTLVGILLAYSHSGLVSESRQQFMSMRYDRRIPHIIEHYHCMIDILGRAGQLDDAEDLINNMPFIADSLPWTSLLGSCKIHADVERGARVAEYLINLDPEYASTYVLMASIYSAAGKHEDAARMRKRMVVNGVKKIQGYSFIHVNYRVYEFLVGDTSHPQNKEIWNELRRLDALMKEAGYVPDTKEVVHHVREEEKEHVLCSHSERLAIAFGLISPSCDNAPIRVFKNLRVCSDCHTYTKFLSKFLDRKIIVRDAIRFHHFEMGKCSCGDYW